MSRCFLLFSLIVCAFSAVSETSTYRLTDFYGGEGVVRMQGKSNTFDIAIPLTSIHKITDASLTIEVTSSQALIKKRSQLFVRFNNATIGQIAFDPNRSSLVSSIVVPATLWREGFNQLTFAVSQHYAEQCVDGNAPELWSEINVYNSTLSVSTELQENAASLAHLSGFFSPGIGGQRAVNIYRARDSAPQLMQRTLPLVSQALALRNQYQPLAIESAYIPDGYMLPDIAEDVSDFWQERRVDNYRKSAWYLTQPQPQNVHVLVGTVEALSPVLSDTTINDIHGAFLKVERTPAFEAQGRTWVNSSYRLIVSGTTDEEVYQAAKALSVMDDVLSPSSSVAILSQQGMQPERLQRTSVLSPGQRYSFSDLGIASERFNDEGDFTKRISLRLPADFYVPENASVELLLDFGYGAGAGPGSIMNVSVNEELVHGLYLGNENGEAFRDYQLRIPARFFKGGVNNIDIGATMRAPLAGVPCDDVFGSHLVFQINHSSSIELPEAGNVAVQPDLGLFSETGYPFARYKTAPQGHIFIPDDLYLDSALTLAGKLAQVAQSPLLNLEVSQDLAVTESGSVIILGTPASLNTVSQDAFVSSIGDTQRWPYRLQNQLYNRVRDITNDKSYKQMRVTGVTVQEADLGNQAVLLAEEHPSSNASDTLFIIAAQTPALLKARVTDLTSLSLWGQLAGDFFVWDDNLSPLLVMQVNEKFEVGEPNNHWLTLRLWLSNNPWYWLLSFLLLVCIVSVFIFVLLKRRNKQVQNSW